MFVRTKYDILEITKDRYIRDNIVYEIDKVDFTDLEYDLGTVIKKTDTIEELCDNFVIEFSSDGVNQIIYPEFQWAKKEFLSNKKGTLYGAIRVAGKGLIYVAKMNEKGDLELI